MNNSLDKLGAQALLLDIDRRLRTLEHALGVGVDHPIAPDLPISIYYESFVGTSHELPVVRRWFTQVLGLGIQHFVVMARAVNDPFPWRPFLRNADQYVARNFVGAPAVQQHILEMATGMLRAQGLRLLSPRDLMGHPIPDMKELSGL